MNVRATVTAKGQITLPKPLRDRLNLKEGDQIAFVEVDGRFVLVPRNLRAIDLAGILGEPPAGLGSTLEDYDEAIMDYVAEDDARITREYNERGN